MRLSRGTTLERALTPVPNETEDVFFSFCFLLLTRRQVPSGFGDVGGDADDAGPVPVAGERRADAVLAARRRPNGAPDTARRRPGHQPRHLPEPLKEPASSCLRRGRCFCSPALSYSFSFS